MHYDLLLVKELCDEVTFKASMRKEDEVAIEFDEDTTLYLKNIETDDCLIGFDGTPWHHHGDLQFSDSRGYYTDVSYLDMVTDISLGKILVCELWESGKLKDRYLIHCEYNDEFRYMQSNEKIVVRSFAISEVGE